MYGWFIRKYGLLNPVSLQRLQPEGASVWQVGACTLRLDLVRLMQLLHAITPRFEENPLSLRRWGVLEQHFTTDVYEDLAYVLQPDFSPQARWDYLQQALAMDHEVRHGEILLRPDELWPVFLDELRQNLSRVEGWCQHHLVGSTMESLKPVVAAVDASQWESEFFAQRAGWVGIGEPICTLLSWANAVVCPHLNREAAVFFWPRSKARRVLRVGTEHLDWSRLWVLDYQLGDMLVEYESVGHIAALPDDEGNRLTLQRAKELALRYWQEAVPYEQYVEDPAAVVGGFLRPDWTDPRAELLYFGDVPAQYVEHPLCDRWHEAIPPAAGPGSARYTLTVSGTEESADS